MAEHKIDESITTNAGIRLLPDPSYILLFDATSAREFATEYNELARMGTRFVTFRDNEPQMTRHVTAGFDVTIERSDKDVMAFGRYEFSTKGHSGQYATHFAAQRATTVILVGHDGYAAGKDDHWYERCCRHWTDKSRDETLYQVYQPFYRRLATVFPEVEFIQYGQPNFQVGNHNWTVIEVEP